jgi:hypothetical protein
MRAHEFLVEITRIARKLNFDEIYGKYLKVTDNDGDPNKEGFSLVTPLNGDSWNWRERPEFKDIVKRKLNQPGWLGNHKYQQIIDAMSGQQFDPNRHLATENFADGKIKGKSRPGRVKRSGASCNGSVTDLRRRAKNSSGEKAKMYHWCANMKSGKKNESEMDEGWKQSVAAGVLGAGMALGGGTAQADTDVLNKKFTPAEIQQIQTKADLTQRYYNELVRRAKEDGRTMDRRTLNMLKAQAEDAVARSVQQQPQAPQAKYTFPGTQPSEIRRSSDYKNFESVKK